MALYANFIEKNDDAIFDKTHDPGDRASCSGIYRCEGCGREVASNQGEPLAPQNHHQHSISQGKIRWRLIVYADHRPH
jgi:hypothetical protein